MITLSRHLAAAVAMFSGLVTLGGFTLGFALQSGQYLALSCVFAGMLLAAYLWWSMAKRPEYIAGINFLCLVTFVLVAGLALYSNLVYLLWILGFPMDIGTIERGNMGKAYWLPPATLLYAVVAWLGLKQGTTKTRS